MVKLKNHTHKSQQKTMENNNINTDFNVEVCSKIFLSGGRGGWSHIFLQFQKKEVIYENKGNIGNNNNNNVIFQILIKEAMGS